MPTNHPPWVEGHSDGPKGIHPTYANAFPSTKQPGSAAVCVHPIMAGQPVDTTPLIRTEQATINTRFAHAKHYFLSLQDIKRACFTTLDASINDAFKMSNDPTVQGWHASMHVIDILDQLSTIYSQPTPAILVTNDAIFCSPHWAWDAPEVFFCQIEECAEMALLGSNPRIDWQLVTNDIRLLLTTRLYIRPFEEWDRLTDPNQTWIALCTMIQEAFQRRLNATAPTTGHHGYAPAMLHQQNTFGMLGQTMVNSDDQSADTVATQVTALTCQSQLTASTVADSIQRAEQQFTHLALQKNLMHENMHQIIAQVNALSFNQSNSGWGRLGSFDSGGRGCGGSRCKQGGAQMAFDGGQFEGGFVLATSSYAPGPTAVVVPYQGGAPPNFYAPAGNHQGGQTQYHLPAGGYGVGGYGNAPPGGHPPTASFLNKVK
jgi:hypothetical protein